MADVSGRRSVSGNCRGVPPAATTTNTTSTTWARVRRPPQPSVPISISDPGIDTTLPVPVPVAVGTRRPSTCEALSLIPLLMATVAATRRKERRALGSSVSANC